MSEEEESEEEDEELDEEDEDEEDDPVEDVDVFLVWNHQINLLIQNFLTF